MAIEKQWIYRASWDHTLVIKPSVRKVVSDNLGNNQLFTEKPVKVVFLNKKLVVNEGMAKKYGLPIETLIQWIEMQPTFNGKFFLVSSPEEPATKEKIKDIDEKLAPKVRVLHGPRATNK